MRAKAFALLIAVSAAIAGCRSTATGPASQPPPGPGPGAVNPQPNPNPAPVTPPPVPAPTPGPSQSGYASGPDSMGSSAPSYPPAAAVPDQAPAAVSARPHHDILKLKQAGLSDEFILNKIRTENVNYQLSTSEILELRSAGLSEGVLEEMLRSGKPPVAVAGAAVERKAEFPGLARVGRGFLGVFGTSTKDVGRLVVDGETISWFQSQDPEQNFSLYLKNVKEVFNTCVLRPGQNLCLEFGLVTYTGDEYKFRDPGWKNGDNRLVTEATTYFRQAFPNLFFTQRTKL
jgi:hypothetical protein